MSETRTIVLSEQPSLDTAWNDLLGAIGYDDGLLRVEIRFDLCLDGCVEARVIDDEDQTFTVLGMNFVDALTQITKKLKHE